MLKTSRSFPSELQSLVMAGYARLGASRAVESLWAQDYRLWKHDPTDITNRLGWLTIIEYMNDRTEELRPFATLAKTRGIRDVVLLGMGGSSLGPEVFRQTFGSRKGLPRVWVLDSTGPGWVQQVTRSIDLTRSLFIPASKSGIFLQLVDKMSPDLRIPGKPFTFRTLAQAQAIGDIQALHANEQQAIVLPLGNNPIATIQALTKSLASRTPVRRPTRPRTKHGRTCKK